MRILSFDSSGYDIQIALVQDDVIAREERITPSRKDRQESASMLLPVIDSATKQLSWSKRSLDLIVVGIGPGSFTGVRVSVITARSIGQALSLGVVPFSSLELLACRSLRPCVVVLNAGAGKIYAAVYDDDISSGSGGLLLKPFCGSPDELHSKLSYFKLEQLSHWVLGDGVNEAALATGNAVLTHAAEVNLAADAGLLAYKSLSPGNNRETLAHLYQWDKVLPLYLASPSVTLKDQSRRTKSWSSTAQHECLR